MTAGAGPLAGIRALDLTRLLPGPLCTQYLADLGAEVIKIEQPGVGDYARTMAGGTADGESSAFFQAVNRGKKSVALDLTQPLGRKRFMQMVEQAHVVIEGFRPGVMERLGVDYPRLAAIRPEIVFVSISGYGQEGDLADKAGHDLNYIARAGLLDQLRDREGQPVIPAFQIGDVSGGSLHGVIAVLAGLVGSLRTGTGARIDVSMTDCCKPFNIGALGLRQDGSSLVDGSHACYAVYETSDGRHVTVAAAEPKFWRRLCAALGREEFIPLQFDGARQQEMKDALGALFASDTRDSWTQRLADIDCCFAPVLAAEEAMAGHSAANSGPALSFALPLRISGHAPSTVWPAPRLGEHDSAFFGSA